MTGETVFEAVDSYIDGLFVETDVVLDAVLERAKAAGLPEMQVSPGQGKLLYLMAKIIGANRILEVGTLGGYSAVWLARAMGEGGKLTTLEVEPEHAAFARETLSDAGLSDSCEVIEGSALASMKTLEPPFDLIFLDANKDQYPVYLNEAVRLTRPGGIILADNVVRSGLGARASVSRSIRDWRGRLQSGTSRAPETGGDNPATGGSQRS